MKMEFLVKLQKKRFLLVNVIFVVTAIILELAGISLNMYVYADNSYHIFNVPLIIIGFWVFVGHTTWVVYRKFGWVVGLLTGIIIDLPMEFLAFHLGWWTWIPSWTPAVFFNAPVANFLVYLNVSIGSILIYKSVMKPKL
ncbi:MAG: hypothetical protein JSV12_03640 [Candidatus Bathyarchaeota archaeon]|nr:MAG: hypothetical protein JSV12_03640 [Candidatus Bathyarchaeota archaeon]